MSKQSEEVTREQLESLKSKFSVLQADQTLYFEKYEKTKSANDTRVKELKSQNKSLRRKLADLRKQAALVARTGENDAVTQSRNQLGRLRGDHDRYKAKVTSLSTDLDALQDQYRDLELEETKPQEEDSPLTRKIRQLENRLDKAMIKYNEAQSIRKTYEQIVKRLKEERVGFDNQLAAIERTLKAKDQDYDELKILAGDAAHAREVAIAELEGIKAQSERELQAFEKEKREKLNLLRARAQTRQMAIRQQQMKLGLGSSRDTKQAEEAEAEDDAIASSALAQEAEEAKRAIEKYESAMRKIKEVTGVSDVNEVIQKVVSQEDQQQSLEELTRDNAKKIERMNADVARMKEKVDTLKFSTSGSGVGARKMVDGYEEQLTMASQRLERAKDKYDRSARILINVKAGVDHLHEKLASVQKDEPAMSDLGGADSENIVDVLLNAEATLVRLLDIVEKAQGERETKGLGDEVLKLMAQRTTRPSTTGESKEAAGGDGEQGKSTSVRLDSTVSALGMKEEDIVNTRVYNTRIDIGEKEVDEEDEEDDMTGAEDDAVSRDTVKRDAVQVLAAQRRKDNRRRRMKETG